MNSEFACVIWFARTLSDLTEPNNWRFSPNAVRIRWASQVRRSRTDRVVTARPLSAESAEYFSRGRLMLNGSWRPFR